MICLVRKAQKCKHATSALAESCSIQQEFPPSDPLWKRKPDRGLPTGGEQVHWGGTQLTVAFAVLATFVSRVT